MERRDYRRDYNYGEWGSAERLIPALILIGIGALFLLSNLHIVYFHDWWRYWPGVLIAVGVIKLVDSQDQGGRVVGGIMVTLGGIFLAQTLGFLAVSLHDLWPLILIGIGLSLLWNKFWEPETWGRKTTGSPSSGTRHIKEAAVFGGGKRRILAQDFTKATFDCVFGGFEIDLRSAQMAGETSELTINAVFGGAEVRVPPLWLVEMRGDGVFGAFTDETTPPPLQTPGIKRLVVKGAAVFGGVSIKN